MRVLLVTEGTYPFYQGGVGNWCGLLVRELQDVEFSVLAMVGDPQCELAYPLPPNVVQFVRVALWGVREALENRRDLGLGELLGRARRTSEAVVTARFIPDFRAFIETIFEGGDPHALGLRLARMYRFFVEHDFDTTLRSRAVWDCFADTASRSYLAAAARSGAAEPRVSLDEVTDSLSLLYHWLIPLAAPLPAADITHAVSSGLCCLVGTVSKLEHGAAFLLTEHGIYLRERYLAEAMSTDGVFRKVFGLQFARRLTELGYAFADRIAPGSKYNMRWEVALGAPAAKVQTVYNGVDPEQFTPATKPSTAPPVVVWLGRIDPLKDVMTLLRAAALVRDVRVDIQFRLYGSAAASCEAYYEKCLALRATLGIEDTVTFPGRADSARSAYNEGDIVVLSSISEGFPYAVIEALLCGKPVVATAVGGVPEAIEGCGIAVEPRNPEKMAEAILTLMHDPGRRAAMGAAAREKAVREFNLSQCTDAYRALYRELGADDSAPASPLRTDAIPDPASAPSHRC